MALLILILCCCLLYTVSSFGFTSSRQWHCNSRQSSSCMTSYALQNNDDLNDVLQNNNDELDDVIKGENGYDVQIYHQGIQYTIFVRRNESILEALERQTILVPLSHIPHECRRGNCLTCSSKVLSSRINNSNDSTSTTTPQYHTNILANVDNGLSPMVSSEIAKSDYILTCSSYVAGPGVVLELDQNDKAWDLIYRKRIHNIDTERLVLEAQAKLLRSVDEENINKWKVKIEEKVE